MKTDEKTMREMRRLLEAYIEVCNDNLNRSQGETRIIGR